MADTKPNITVDYVDWVDAYALSNISVGATVQVVNRSSIDVIYIVSPTKPSPDSRDGTPLLPNEKVVIDDKPSGIWMKAESGSYPAYVSVQHTGIREANLTLPEKASADGTLRVGFDIVPITNGQTQYWELTVGSAPDQLALLTRFISAFENSGIKYYVYDGTGLTISNRTNITRFPNDAGITWQRVSAPSPLPSTILDYTTIPKAGVGSGAAGGVEGFSGLRIQPNDSTFILAAHNLTSDDIEFILKLEWIKTDDPDYFR